MVQVHYLILSKLHPLLAQFRQVWKEFFNECTTRFKSLNPSLYGNFQSKFVVTDLDPLKLYFFIIFRQRDPHYTTDQDSSIPEDASITRNFRYMRRKPTIISYQPPPGDLDQDGNQLLSDVVVDSDHMILDRIQGRDIQLYKIFL